VLGGLACGCTAEMGENERGTYRTCTLRLHTGPSHPPQRELCSTHQMYNKKGGVVNARMSDFRVGNLEGVCRKIPTGEIRGIGGAVVITLWRHFFWQGK